MRERNIDWLLLTHPYLGTSPATQACALIGNLTGDLSICRLVLNPLSHTSGVYWLIFNMGMPLTSQKHWASSPELARSLIGSQIQESTWWFHSHWEKELYFVYFYMHLTLNTYTLISSFSTDFQAHNTGTSLPPLTHVHLMLWVRKSTRSYIEERGQ